MTGEQLMIELSPTVESVLAANIMAALIARGDTVAVAESLTGGLVAAALTSVPGSSAAFRGGVVAYASDLKVALLGVDAALLAREGAVHADVAMEMARGVAAKLGATYGLATTGVAGPAPQDGHPIGEVHIAVVGPGGPVVELLDLPSVGDRAAIRVATVEAALALLGQVAAR